MKYYNVSLEILEKALKYVNIKYDDNVIWNSEPSLVSKRKQSYHTTLRVKSSSKIGARRSATGSKMISACWHVHGDFFDIMFMLGCNLITGGYDKVRRLYSEKDNWDDFKITHNMYMSEACEC